MSSQPDTPSNEPSTETAPESQAEEHNKDVETTPSTDTPSSEDVQEEQPAFGISDLEAFKQHEQHPQQRARQQPPQPQTQQAPPGAPPIITYPEFLVEAHKPPPFITPTRVLNAVYAAGGAATLLYAASKWIITPMVESLSESRHDFLAHSQSKVDDFNERLAKIVSKVPESKKELHAAEADMDGAETETSDPTELFHRDMGTQTSPMISPSEPDTPEEKKDAVTYQTGALEIMKEHINELTEGSEKTAEMNKDRQDTVNKLRHYLDGLQYSGTGISPWTSSEDAIAMKNDKPGDDAIEELKKEIRGVKGVLLSAKRFPAVSRPVTGAA